MSIGAPLGARRSRGLADDTFPIAGQDRIFDIAFDATFIATRPVHSALLSVTGRGGRLPCRRVRSYVPFLSFDFSVPGVADEGGVVDDEDAAPLDDDGGVGALALDDDVSVELDDDVDGVDGVGDDDDEEDGGVIGAVDWAVDDDDGGVVDVDVSRWQAAAPSTSATPITRDSLRFIIGRPPTGLPENGDGATVHVKQDRCH
jgi:hypothetical protein